MSPGRRSRPIEVDLDEELAEVEPAEVVSPVRKRRRGRPPVPVAQPQVEAEAADDAADDAAGKPEKKPLYPRLLRLRHIEPNAWQRAALGEGAIGVGVLLAMADLASAWTIVALPVAVAAIVKAHDALQGLLDRTPPPPPPG